MTSWSLLFTLLLKVTSAETIARVLGGENGKKSDNIKMKNDPSVDTGESFVSRL